MDTFRISLTLLIGIIIAQQNLPHHAIVMWNFHPKLFTGVIMKRKSYFDRNSSVCWPWRRERGSQCHALPPLWCNSAQLCPNKSRVKCYHNQRPWQHTPNLSRRRQLKCPFPHRMYTECLEHHTLGKESSVPAPSSVGILEVLGWRLWAEQWEAPAQAGWLDTGQARDWLLLSSFTRWHFKVLKWSEKICAAVPANPRM